MSASDRAAVLEAELEALKVEAALEADLLAAKSACAEDPSPQAYAAKQEVARALRAHRAANRTEGVSVGGDAFVDEEV